MSCSPHPPTPLFFDLPPPPADCEAAFQIATLLCSLPAPFTDHATTLQAFLQGAAPLVAATFTRHSAWD
eukprot:1841129-Rhodomonas_salina.1